MKGRSTKGTTGLGTVEVSGRRRVPSPPARMSACTGGSAPAVGARPADALVDQAGSPYRGRVPVVAAGDEQASPHPVRDLGEVELRELGPLRHQDDGVGVLDGVERGAR